MPSEAYRKYKDLLSKLEAIRATRKDGSEDPRENAILDAMDSPWLKMTEDEQRSFEGATMHKYIYRDNNETPPRVVFECTAKGILEADKLFEKKVGRNPAKMPHIGCSGSRVEVN